MDNGLKLKLYSFTLDCEDPHTLAEFYAALLGWEVVFSEEEYACAAPHGVQQGAYPGITFQRNPQYKPPVWPDEPDAQQQMAHIDIAVSNLDKAVQHALQCGASVAGTQFSEGWTVMFDPAGHPFCLCLLKHIFTENE